MIEIPAALASWAGVAPGNNVSAGRSLSGRSTHGNRWLLGAFGHDVLYRDPGLDYFHRRLDQVERRKRRLLHELATSSSYEGGDADGSEGTTTQRGTDTASLKDQRQTGYEISAMTPGNIDG